MVRRALAALAVLAPIASAWAAGSGQTPPVEPVPREFWVFFDSGQYAIRTEDRAILDGAVAAVKKLGRAKVLLTGHTDYTGLHTSDVRLSRWRAEEVKKYLVKNGVPEHDIATVAKGESDPRVATPRGVAEQENRNVHIELK